MQIDANGVMLDVQEHGPADGAPLILIRGLGTLLSHWPKALIDGFVRAGFRTIIFDNRDVGLSQRCPTDGAPCEADAILDLIRAGEDLPVPYTISDMASDVIGLMDTLEIDRAHVMGISICGTILQVLAVEQVNRLLSATIVMTAARPLISLSNGDPNRVYALAKSLLTRPMTRDAYIDAQVEEHENWGSPGYPMPEPEIRAMAAECWARGVDPDGMNRQLLASANAPDRRPALRDVALLCQVIHGNQDALIPVDLGAEIAAHIPGAAFHAIDGMGHIITPALAPKIVDLVSGLVAERASL